MKLWSSGRIVLLGCGAVSRCFQALLLKNAEIEPSRFVLIDARAQSQADNPLLGAGASFIHFRLTQENYQAFLHERLHEGDVLVNLSAGVESADILEWAHCNGVVYIDTSVEVWRERQSEISDPLLDTIFMRHTQLYRRSAEWKRGGPTAILEHGANPGLVNHWVKFGLEYIASQTSNESVQQAANTGDYARLAMLTGTKTIHISERDRQVLPLSRKPAEFVNTWSPEGLREESSALAECAWGTHERELPADALHLGYNRRFHVCIRRKALHSPVRSWVPTEEMVGLMVPHGETFTIGNRLSLWENGKLIYRPTVCFVYRPSNAALESLSDFVNNSTRSLIDRLMTSDISDGSDDLGVLLMGSYGAIWVGNRLSISRTREIVGERHNATVLQVAASVLGALGWALDNRRSGLLLPGDIPFEQVLPTAHKYIGELEVHPTDWQPESINGSRFAWQFADFSLLNEEADAEPLLRVKQRVIKTQKVGGAGSNQHTIAYASLRPGLDKKGAAS